MSPKLFCREELLKGTKLKIYIFIVNKNLSSKFLNILIYLVNSSGSKHLHQK